MGHIGSNALKSLGTATNGCLIDNRTAGNEQQVPGPDQLDEKCRDCEVCIQAKATAKIGREKPIDACTYLEKVHSDICGPIKPQTFRKRSYFATFLDDMTRYVEISLLSSKSEVFDAYKEFKTREETQSGLKIKRFHADNAPEYKSQGMLDLHKASGTVATYSAPYTPAQNGRAEIINRTIMNKARAMLIQAKLPKMYWGEAVLAAQYLYNRTPHSAIGYKTPYELKTGTKPDISHIRVWGSIAYRKLPNSQLKKLDNRAVPLILVGYGSNQYKLLNPVAKTTIWVRDALILENRFIDTLDGAEPPIPDEQLVVDEPDTDQLARMYGFDEQPIDIEDGQVSSEPEIPIDEFIEQLQNAAEEIALPTVVAYRYALQSPDAIEWVEAINEEYRDLMRQKTWDLVPLPPGRKAIPGHFVLTIKDTIPPKKKARWVAKGFHQRPGEDFSEVFANTVNPVVYRLLLAYASLNDWEIRQWDVKSAFTCAKLDEVIYIQQPTGFEVPGSEKLVCRLNKALYGLKQSARAWEQHLKRLLAKLAIIPLKIDQSVYISTTGTPIILSTHVDDLLVLSPYKKRVIEVLDALNKDIPVKDLGDAETFLGMQIIRDRQAKSLILHQTAYTERTIKKFRPKLAVKEAATGNTVPVPVGYDIDQYDGIQSPEATNQYQQEVGSLLYLAGKTRPDIAYAVGLLSRYSSNPGPQHQKLADQLWKYLATTPSLGLYFHQMEPNIAQYVDADYGGDKATRRSTTGYISLFRGAAVTWRSTLQKTVALSSCEAEYMAIREAIKEALYIRAVTAEIPFLQDLLGLKELYTDSQSAIDLALNPRHHQRTKHVDITYHFVRETVQEDLIQLRHIGTNDQLADYLTKAMPSPKWQKYIDQVGLKGSKNCGIGHR